MTNERELSNALTIYFFQKIEQVNENEPKLVPIERKDIKGIYKLIQFPKSVNGSAKIDQSKNRMLKETAKSTIYSLENETDISEERTHLQMYDKLTKFNESFNLSSTELSLNIIQTFCKLVQTENRYLFKQTDHDSVTNCSFKFAVKVLTKLYENAIYNDNDQTVIKISIMKLVFLCFKNLLKCDDDKSVGFQFKELINQLQLSNETEITCGLIICIANILAFICMTYSSQKQQVLNLFNAHIELMLEKIEFIGSDVDLLFILQRNFIKIINAIKTHNYLHRKKQRRKQRKETDSESSSVNHHHNHHMQAEVCVFERLLINSVVHMKRQKYLSRTLGFFKMNGFCCVNANIETINILMRSIIPKCPLQNLEIVEKRILRLILHKSQFCVRCNEKCNSDDFKQEYFKMLLKEVEKRRNEGQNDLLIFLRHLISIQKLMPNDFLKKFILIVILPTFKEAKQTFLKDPENNQCSKLIAKYCLQLLNESTRCGSIVEYLMTDDMIVHLKDCSLIPMMSTYSCLLLQCGIDNFKEETEIYLQVKAVLFSNIRYLINEIIDIYDQAGLQHDDKDLSKKSNENFEILDENIVAIKENLTNLDVILLNAVHWKCFYDLITKHLSFRSDFVANICNNFNGNILFTIAHHALGAILSKIDVAATPSINSIFEQNNGNCNYLINYFERCDYLSPIIVNKYDINYDLIMSRSYKLFEICQKFTDKLNNDSGDENSFRHLFNIAKNDKKPAFKIATIHRDNFLTDNMDEYVNKLCAEEQSENVFINQWMDSFKIGVGIFEGKTLRDVFAKIVNRFVHPEDELRDIYRTNTIKEITGNCGIKYFSFIARNCFDICFRLSDDHNNKLGNILFLFTIFGISRMKLR